ncbi:MAG TPA: hypothetical protein VL899_12975 [Alphaproteobacteria bacterium]|jgi:hypothetical protein|nr:hypothetical protein [Alphaproteobacteria bacterium]
MTIRSTLTAGLCLAAASPFAAQAAAPQPATGFYQAVAYITAATPTGGCALMGETVASTKTGVFYYPGASATGAILSIADAARGQIFQEIFSKTPAAGATTWKGSFKAGDDPGPYLTIPFTGKITYVDTHSFTAVQKATITIGTDKCQISRNLVFILTGT